MSGQLTKAILLVETGRGTPQTLEVQFNPKQLDYDRTAQFADMNIPGLDVPITQFVRGNGESLTLDLFFDTTDEGTANRARSVNELTDPFTQLVLMEPQRHAPPVCTFLWGPNSPNRKSYRCVVEAVKHRLTMFSTEGIPVRATLALKLKEYRPLEEQRPRTNLTSPDRTHAHIVVRGERIADVAALHYRDPNTWRAIAIENHIEEPLRLEAGRVLTVPPLR